MDKLISILFDTAYAMAPSQGNAPEGGGSLFGAFMPLILIFGIFYFLLIRPQQRQQKQHRDFLTALEKGTDVVTSGGIMGKVTGITDNTVTLEIAEKVKIKVLKAHILQPSQPQNMGAAKTATAKS